LLAQNKKDSLVVVPIELIEQANIKLAERNYYKELSQKQDEMIFDLQELNYYRQQTIDKLKNDNLKLTEKNQEYIDLNYSLAKNLEISRRRNIIFGKSLEIASPDLFNWVLYIESFSLDLLNFLVSLIFFLFLFFDLYLFLLSISVLIYLLSIPKIVECLPFCFLLIAILL